MRFKILAVLFGALVLSWAAQDARAGAIRYAGEKIGQGTAAVAQTTADAAQTAGSGVANAGKATGGAIKTGAVAVGNGAKATPGIVARGTAAAAKGVWKAIW